MHDLPEAGVGMMYLPGLESLMESHFRLLDVIEIEPQTLWYNKDAKCDSFVFNPDRTRLLQEYPGNKLFHSVGFPVGGRVLPGNANLALLHEHALLLSPLWISEHLSFNTVEHDGGLINTNFLLPPLQTKEGIDVAVKGINYFTSKIPLPFAFETGVNYLRKKNYELPDGRFVAEIATRADSLILLDLHNIMANQINGRQSIDEFVSQLPLERVCEIHIAGGFYHNDYYLDGHSGISSNELFEILERLVRKLPALKAIIFEMLPEYIKDMTDELMNFQLEQMHRIWDKKGREWRVEKRGQESVDCVGPETQWSVKDWEYMLGKAAIEQSLPFELPVELSEDKGLKIINELIFHFRASMIVTTLQLTTRLLRLTLGTELFSEHLKKFFVSSTPEVLAFAAAQRFEQYLEAANFRIPYLDKILEYEMASLHTMIDNRSRSVEFNYNPFPVLRSLSNSELPPKLDNDVPFVLEIKPDEDCRSSESFSFSSVYHN